MNIKVAFILLLVMTLSGCALTQTVKQVDYVPNVDKGAVAGISGSTSVVRVGSFTDNRGVENPALLFHKKNMYNNTMSGAYLAQRPLVDYVKDGVVASLKEAGVISETNGLILTASLEDFDEEILMGFWKSKLSTKMTIKFTLRNGAKQVWNDTIIGKALIDKGDFVTQAVTLTSDDVVRQLLNNEQFKQAISGEAQ